MFLEENIVSILAFSFFVPCIFLIIHLSFLVENNAVKKMVYINSLVYGIMVSALEVSSNINTQNLGFSTSRIVGGVLGVIAGFYLGYQFCILIKIMEDTRFIKPAELSNIDTSDLTEPSINNIPMANAICFIFSTITCELGVFLGNVLFPI